MIDLLDKNLHLCIPPIRPYQKDELELSEVELEIKNGQLLSLDRNPSQDEWRFITFVSLLQEASKKKTLPNTKFILNMYEGVYTDKTQRFAYTAKLNSGHILIPDAHSQETRNKLLAVKNRDIPFAAKIKQAIFAGSDTGARRKDGWTMRSLVSYFYRHSKKVRAGISTLDADAVKRFDGSISLLDVSGPPLTIHEQLQSQVILNIDGNSTSWERLLWVMASNSLCVFVKPFDGEEMYSWYYPLLEMTGVVPMIEYDRLEKFMDNDFSADYWQQKIADQKVFANYVASLDTQIKFLSMVLSKYAEVNA